MRLSISQFGRIACLLLSQFWLTGCVALAFEGDAYTVEMQAVPGYNSHQVRSLVINRLAQEPRVDYAVILVGTNDCLNSTNLVDVSIYSANLFDICRRVTESGAVPLLATIPPVIDAYVAARHPALTDTPGNLVDDYNLALRVVAESTSPSATRVIELHADFEPRVSTAADSLIRNMENVGATDGIHPTVEGYARLAWLYAQAVVEAAGPEPGGRVVIFGDSITAGVHAPEADWPVNVLRRLLNPNRARAWKFYD